jgi:hypothetical protein
MRLIAVPEAAPKAATPAPAPRALPRRVPPSRAPDRQSETAPQPAAQHAATAQADAPIAAGIGAPHTPLNVGPAARRAASAAVSAAASTRDQALNDPRANTHSPNRAERFAQSLGSDEVPGLSEQAMGDGRIIVRKGRDCYDVRSARNAEIDPFSQTSRPTPRLATGCGGR